MAIKSYKPTTPARRNMTVSAFDGIDKKAKPERSLTETLKKNAGRNSYGRITVRHRGGGNKRKYRIIDFKRDKMDAPATVLRLEYDPNRSANIALVQYEDGEKQLHPGSRRPEGRRHRSCPSAAADIKPGNCLPLANIPAGTIIHNIELYPGKGGQLVRSAGTSAQLMAKEGDHGPDPYALRRGAYRPSQLQGLPSVRSATPTTRTSPSVRLAGSVTWVGDPPSAAPS